MSTYDNVLIFMGIKVMYALQQVNILLKLQRLHGSQGGKMLKEE